MKQTNNYAGLTEYGHDQPIKTGILLVNLGTPDKPEKEALRPYLKRFLSDPRVIELSGVGWKFILNNIILRFRPAKSAKAYQEVWREEGSPLLIYTKSLAEKLQHELNQHEHNRVTVDYAMSYSTPYIDDALVRFREAGIGALIVIPLYPQYSGSTVGSVYDQIADSLKKWRWVPQLHFINSYYDEPAYIDAIADSIKSHRAEHGDAQSLFFSYHGIPTRYVKNGDPYSCQCLKTSQDIIKQLELKEDQYQVCFQSRFGREEWLQPYADKTLEKMAKAGVESIQVICPGFAVDCLETLEEMAVENKELFLENGGKRYEYIPCLNDGDAQIKLFAQISQRHIDVIDQSSRFNRSKAALEQTKQRWLDRKASQ